MSQVAAIPEVLRYPGVYIQVDPTRAGTGAPGNPNVLLVGQKLSTGTVAAGQVVQVADPVDAANKAGPGSMLAMMAAAYRNVEKVFNLWILPYADNPAGVQATGTIVVSTVATANGTIALYINGIVVSVAITVGQTTAQIAAAIQAAIAALGTGVPVTATVGASTVTLTALHKGSCGNNIDFRLSLYNEPVPAGLTLSLTAMTGGSGDPAPGAIDSILGTMWFRYIALGMNDAATLAAWHAESELRYAFPVFQGFRAFTAYRGAFTAAAAFGSACNYEHISDLSIELNPISTWESAAIYCAAAAPALFANPVQSLEGTPLPGLIGKTYHSFTNANLLLWDGMSVMQMDPSGNCSIKMAISMFQFKPDGSPDDAYLYINTPETMEQIRIAQSAAAHAAFVGTAAAATDDGYRPGLPITTTNSVIAFLLSFYKNTLIKQNGWCQNYEFYKANLIVQQDPLNPSRFNYIDTPVILSPFYILAGQSQFYKTAQLGAGNNG